MRIVSTTVSHGKRRAYAAVTNRPWPPWRARVSQAESEQVFFNRPLVVHEDAFHSDRETRYFALLARRPSVSGPEPEEPGLSTRLPGRSPGQNSVQAG